MAIHERIQILNLEVDCDHVSDFRILVDGRSFKYVTIDSDVYDPGVMVWDRSLIPLLPPIPKGDWNEGHIARHPERGTPYFARYAQVALATICNRWHSTHIDWLDLQRGQKLMSNVYTATWLKKTAGKKGGSADDLVIKFARFPWEIQYYEAETDIYKCIEGRAIGPRFLGHLTEDGRVIGIVLERIRDARHAEPLDLEACQDALGELHQQGILHGDVNKHNFLVREGDQRKTVTVIDFESASKSTDKVAFEEELERLEEELHATDGRGAYSLDYP